MPIWTLIKIEQALGDVKYGSQNTDGSCSIRDFYDAMRDAGASARLMLERAAAAKWGVPAGECKAQNHQVVHASGKASSVTANWRRLPRSSPCRRKKSSSTNPRQSTATSARTCRPSTEMTSDDGQGNLRHRCANAGHGLRVDRALAGAWRQAQELSTIRKQRKSPGVQQTVVIARLQTAARISSARRRCGNRQQHLGGDEGPREAQGRVGGRRHTRATIRRLTNKSLLETVRKPQKAARNVGDVDAEFAKGGKTHEAEYYVPHLSHAPMEPPAAVAEFKDGKVVVYAATQNPQAVQDTVAAALGIDKKNVECHVTLLGGGFGRKSKPDYVAEAALLSKAVGKPVKVTWSREDDIRFDYYHTVSAMYMKAAVDDKGKPTAWLQRCAFPIDGVDVSAPAANIGAAAASWAWAGRICRSTIPNHRAENGPAQTSPSHRLAAFGGEYPACIRDSFVRG